MFLIPFNNNVCVTDEQILIRFMLFIQWFNNIKTKIKFGDKIDYNTV